MKEGITEQDDTDKCTCTKRTYPTKVMGIFNIPCCSVKQIAGAFISFCKYLNKHFIHSSFLNVGFQQQYLNDNDVTFKGSFGTFPYQIAASMLYENNYGSPTGRGLLYFVSEHSQFDLLEIQWNQCGGAVAFNDGGVYLFKTFRD